MTEGIRESRSVTYASARAAVEGAHRRAEMLGIAAAAAAVDGAGNIVAVGRMDDAPFGVTSIAIDKAFTAAAFAAPTDAWQHSTQPGGADWGMHTSLSGRLTVYPGGVLSGADGNL
jgi:uncharacterized protein GlcG (DUF336 family)